MPFVTDRRLAFVDQTASVTAISLPLQRSTQTMQSLSFPQWMRRFAPAFAIVSIALVLMAPLAACGGGSRSGSTSTGPGNLTFWNLVTDPRDSTTHARFNQTHHHI